MASSRRPISTMAGAWLGLAFVQACTAIPCPSGQVERGGKCRHVDHGDAGGEGGNEAGVTAEDGAVSPGMLPVSEPDASDAHSATSGEPGPSDAGTKPDAAPDAGMSTTPVKHHDAAGEGDAGQDGGRAGQGAVDAGGTTASEPVDRDLGACPAVGSAQLITRHETISLPEAGAAPLKLLSTRCQGDPQPALSTRAMFELHNQGDAATTVHCTLVGHGVRDEGKLTLASQAVGMVVLQIASASAPASPASMEPSSTLSCEVSVAGSNVRVESIRMLQKVPQNVIAVAAP